MRHTAYIILYVSEKPNSRTLGLNKLLLRQSFTIRTHSYYVSEKLNFLLDAFYCQLLPRQSSNCKPPVPRAHDVRVPQKRL